MGSCLEKLQFCRARILSQANVKYLDATPLFFCEGGHNRVAVGWVLWSGPRVGLVPRPTLGWEAQRRWRWRRGFELGFELELGLGLGLGLGLDPDPDSDGRTGSGIRTGAPR